MTRNHWECIDTRNRSFGWRTLRIIGLAIGGIFLAALFALVLGIVAQWLWNWLMPDLFGLKQITYWQAFGLIFLGRLLFGGFGHHGPHNPKKYSHPHPKEWEKYKRFWKEKGDEAAEDLIGETRTDCPT